MRQILVEHPARVEMRGRTGCDRISSELSPGHHHAGDIGSRVPAVFYCILACRGNTLVARCGSLAGFGHPVHTHRHPTDEQAVIEPCTGQAISEGRSTTRPLGQVARREKRTEHRGALTIPLPLNFHKIGLTGE
jgi:hypothetical protein